MRTSTVRSARRGRWQMATLAAILGVAGCDAGSGGGDARDAIADAPAAVTVQVIHGGDTQTVDLSTPDPVTVGELPFVRLSDVAARAFPSLDLATVTADFEGGDGFKPASKANCATLIPVDGGTLARGYISPSTRNLAWDDALQYPGCMRVSDAATITLVDR